MVDLDRKAVAWLALVAAVFLIGGIVSWTQTRQVREDAAWLLHTQDVLLGGAEVLDALASAEAGQRAFLIGGDEQFLPPFDAARVALPAALDRLAALTADNPAQQQRVAQLRTLVSERLASLSRGIALRREQGFGPVPEALARGRGPALMASFRTLIGEIQAEERTLLAQRRRASEAAYRAAQALHVLVAALGLALVIAIARLLRRGILAERAAAARVAEQREWFRTTLASIGDGVIATDAQGRVSYMNAPAERLSGWRREDAAGRPLPEVFAIVDEASRVPLPDPASRALAESRAIELPNRAVLQSRDGGELPIDDSAAPVHDAAGGIVGAVLVFRDISRRRRDERELAERSAEIDRQREMLRVTLASIGDGVITTDGEGRVAFLNPVAESLTGWPLAEAAGRPLESVFRIVNEYTRAVVDNPVAKVLRQGVVIGLANHTVLIARDGGERPIEDSAAPIRGGDGQVAGVVLVFHDASESREAQAALRASEQQLREANVQLAEADRRKDEFLATLAHELRNPLAPLRNALELIGRPLLSDERRAQARELMLRQLRQMTRLIDELMDVSRIGRGKIELRRERLDLRAVVEAALEIARPSIEQHGHALAVSLPDEPVPMWIDRTRVAQVLSNVLNNAAKYTPSRGRIVLEATLQPDWAEIRVADNGVGISAELLPHIFDMFVQGERATVQSHGGLGVGLSLARRLAELHGGSLQASSAGRGQGSEFVLRLPRPSAPDLPPAVAAAEEPALPPGLRVLVVDDNREAADVLGELLAELGATVRVVYGGAAALEAMPGFAPAAVLLDIGMPGMDGHELAARIRAEPGGGAVLLVAVSGWNQPGDRDRSSDSGIDHHLPKPTDLDELAALLSAPRLPK